MELSHLNRDETVVKVGHPGLRLLRVEAFFGELLVADEG